LRSWRKMIQSAPVFVFRALAQARSLSLRRFPISVENHRLFRPFILNWRKGACLLINFKNSEWKRFQANSTSSRREICSHSKFDKSSKNACSWKSLKSPLSKIRSLVFGSLAFLTTAMAQWSLRSFPKTPTSGYLLGAFVIIRSRSDDLEGYLMLGRVGLSINWLRFNESQIDFKPSEADDNRSWFRSPHYDKLTRV